MRARADRKLRRAPRERVDVLFYSPWIGPLIAPGADPPTGGAETQIMLLARSMAARGLRTAIVTYAIREPLPQSLDGVRLVVQPRSTSRLLPLRLLANAFLLLRTLSSVRARVYVQRTASSTTGLVALAARASGRRFVYSSANVIDFDYGRLDTSKRNVALFHLGTRLADPIVVQTPEQASLCRERFGKTPVMIHSVAEPAPRRTREPEAFLWIGRLAFYKRPLAFVELARAVPEGRFWMIATAPAGEGEAMRAELELEVSQVPNLELLDPRPRQDLPGLIDRAVAIVNTADYEGMPNVFLEGWARGVPALSLAHDPDGVIERERLGGFADGSPERLAELTTTLWGERGDQVELAERCHSYVGREHSEDVIVSQWIHALGLEQTVTTTGHRRANMPAA